MGNAKSRPGFDLGLPCLFPKIKTVTSQAPQTSNICNKNVNETYLFKVLADKVTTGIKNRSSSVSLFLMTYEGHTISFQTFFVVAFQIVVES